VTKKYKKPKFKTRLVYYDRIEVYEDGKLIATEEPREKEEEDDD